MKGRRTGGGEMERGGCVRMEWGQELGGRDWGKVEERNFRLLLSSSVPDTELGALHTFDHHSPLQDRL